MAEMTAMISPKTEAEETAEQLSLALQSIMLSQTDEGRQAERYRQRLRFALDRVEALQRSSAALGGVFEPARHDVALSILEAHNDAASAFVEQVVARLRRERARAGDRAARERMLAGRTPVPMPEEERRAA